MNTFWGKDTSLYQDSCIRRGSAKTFSGFQARKIASTEAEGRTNETGKNKTKLLVERFYKVHAALGLVDSELPVACVRVCVFV